jgi:hypothetical protein
VSEFGLNLSEFYALEKQMERIKKKEWCGVKGWKSGLFEVAPVRPGADFHDDGHGQLVDVFHFFLN